MMRPDLLSATHVAFDSFTPDRLTQLGARGIVRSLDNLLLGPISRDPSAHARARAAWWGSSEEWDQLYSSAVRWTPPVVLWVSASTQQRVNFWRACHWLREKGLGYRDIFALRFDAVPLQGEPEEALPPFDCHSSVVDYSDEVLLQRLSEAHPISRTHFNWAVNLWETYTAPDPRPFARTCARGVDGFPELAGAWEFLSSFVPRKNRAGALHLSRFDALLLGVLSDDWQTPVSVFVHKSQSGVELRQLGSCTGDLFFPQRLDEWAQHGAMPAVEHAAGPTPENPMKAAVFRITERGRELRDKGLARITDGPELPFAGTVAYSSHAPWVLLEDGRLDRLP